MFKRLLAWLGLRRTPEVPSNARYVVATGGDYGRGGKLVLVVPPESGVIMEPVRYSAGGIMSRQNWLDENGESSVTRRARNREWLVRHLPDECLFT